MNYFVTGLPRSRTAWFSKWLPDCLHEGLEGCYTGSQFIDKIGVGGNSDSGLAFFDVGKYFPEAPVLIVNRDIDEVCDSLAKIGLFNDNVYKILLASSARLKSMNGLNVDFHNLNLEEIWGYLIGTQFDELRARRMDKENIQMINYNPDIQAMNSLFGGA